VKKTLGVAVVGLGRIGRRHAAQLAWRTPGCRVVAASSAAEDDRTWAARELPGARWHAGYADVLADREVEAVVLATPSDLHAAQTIAALQAGKHVFCEKPLSLQLSECERVAAVARAHPDQVVLIGFVRRFDPSYVAAHAAVARGDIGQPFLIRSQTCDRNDPSGFFVRFAPTSGGLFQDMCVHDIDLARWMLGHPRAERVFASGHIVMHHGLADCGDVDNGHALIEFEGGARALLYGSRTFAHGHQTHTEVIGTAGQVAIGGAAGAARDRVVTLDAQGVRFAGIADFWERFEQAFAAEMEAFVSACRGQSALPIGIDEATEATRIALALTRSLRSGQVEVV
jgi:myo-inositol 2-dehydrogenase/D-chiro-inositol 1-dehydrogenase